MRLVVLMMLLVASVADATTYRIRYNNVQSYARCAAMWNGAPWVLDLQPMSMMCGSDFCTDAAQVNVPPGTVQLWCYGVPDPAATPIARSNTMTVPGGAVPSPSVTATPLPTATKTATPQPTATKTATPLPTATATKTASPTATPTATATPTVTRTTTPSPSPTKTATATPTATATITPSATQTPVPTWTPLMACVCACPTPGGP